MHGLLSSSRLLHRGPHSQKDLKGKELGRTWLSVQESRRATEALQRLFDSRRPRKVLSCQGQTEPRLLDEQPKATSHHHSPHGLYSAPLSEEAPG